MHKPASRRRKEYKRSQSVPSSSLLPFQLLPLPSHYLYQQHSCDCHQIMLQQQPHYCHQSQQQPQQQPSLDKLQRFQQQQYHCHSQPQYFCCLQLHQQQQQHEQQLQQQQRDQLQKQTMRHSTTTTHFNPISDVRRFSQAATSVPNYKMKFPKTTTSSLSSSSSVKNYSSDNHNDDDDVNDMNERPPNKNECAGHSWSIFNRNSFKRHAQNTFNINNNNNNRNMFTTNFKTTTNFSSGSISGCSGASCYQKRKPSSTSSATTPLASMTSANNNNNNNESTTALDHSPCPTPSPNSVKSFNRTPSSPSILFNKVKDKIREKVMEASTEWPQMAIIIQERRQKAVEEFEARLQKLQQVYHQFYTSDHSCSSAGFLRGHQRRHTQQYPLRTISSDQILFQRQLHQHQQQQQQLLYYRQRTKSESSSLMASLFRNEFDLNNSSSGSRGSKDGKQEKSLFRSSIDKIFLNKRNSSKKKNSITSILSPSSALANNATTNASNNFGNINNNNNNTSTKGNMKSGLKKNKKLHRVGGSVDVQMARSVFRRRSISDDITDNSRARNVSSGSDGVVCSNEDLMAIIEEHQIRRSMLARLTRGKTLDNECSGVEFELNSSRRMSFLYNTIKSVSNNNEEDVDEHEHVNNFNQNSSCHPSPISEKKTTEMRTAGNVNQCSKMGSSNSSADKTGASDVEYTSANSSARNAKLITLRNNKINKKIDEDVSVDVVARDDDGVDANYIRPAKPNNYGELSPNKVDAEIIGQAIQLHLEKIIKEKNNDNSCHVNTFVQAETDDDDNYNKNFISFEVIHTKKEKLKESTNAAAKTKKGSTHIFTKIFSSLSQVSGEVRD
ncbi:hypothetical protein HELRODRAFT_190011 [Helobdella robusta]|uniref:Uncharacterized protein n=1 Tax=Helobdella robusta TaxID=6412 RepID=T1FRL3_HELRO|nr:hypothetical protein HELRODRAFT_190011 [Helobdella robusta]ESO11580.1 hypothetical protein HELRODRAFT_190011 [Helobdella robusta]